MVHPSREWKLPREARTLRGAGIALAATLTVAGLGQGAESRSDWLTGPAYHQRLRESVGPTGPAWSGTPLRQAVYDLARAKHVAAILDRRIDPGQELDVTLPRQTLGEVLESLARHAEMGIAFAEPVVYFGPPRSARRLRTLVALRHQDLKRLPPAARRKLLATSPLAWNDFTEPRRLLEESTQRAGLSLKGGERVPHDLWSAADLPSMDLAQRLTLLLIQFDLTFEVSADGREIAVVPVPEEVCLVRDYPGGPRPEDTARRIATAAPACEVKVAGGKVFVKGMLEDHERIVSPRPAAPPRSSGDDKPRPVPLEQVRIDSLNVQNTPLRRLLEDLSDKLGLEFEADEQELRRAGVSLNQLVSFELKNASVDDLLRSVLGPAGLEFRRRGRTVKIRPAQ